MVGNVMSVGMKVEENNCFSDLLTVFSNIP
jgi:hypothetical protein